MDFFCIFAAQIKNYQFMEIQIADRLLINPANFGVYDQDIVHTLLLEVASQTDRLTGHQGETVCHICKSPYDHPLCMRALQGHNVIFLSTEGNYWCQWVYQFAHEYLHHLINGSLSGEIDGVIWFEETLCELSSIWHIINLHGFCAVSESPTLRGYAPSALGYQNALLSSNLGLKSQIQAPGDIARWFPLLAEPQHHRDHYNAIACHILHLFQENPLLWHIAAHIVDSHRYESLPRLWAHLREVADDSWRGSLEKLIRILS